MTLARFKDLCLDAGDTAGLGRFWGEVLGLSYHPQDGGDAWLSGDVTVPDLDALVKHGATVLRRPAADAYWHVMADPEGNEFCAFPG